MNECKKDQCDREIDQFAKLDENFCILHSIDPKKNTKNFENNLSSLLESVAKTPDSVTAKVFLL